jgi:hypothetical protein
MAAAPAPIPLIRTVPISSSILPKPTSSDEKTQKGFKVGSPSETDKKCEFTHCTTQLTPALSVVMCACEKVFCTVHRKPSVHNCPIDLKNMSNLGLEFQSNTWHVLV